MDLQLMINAFKKFLFACFLSMASCFAWSGAALAQGVSEILDCRAIADDAERLACFDHTTSLVADAVASSASPEEEDGALQSVAQASNDPDDSFGAEDLRQRRNKDEDDDADKSLEAKLVGLRFTSSGRYVITLDNGQVWRQIRGDSETLTLPRISGDGVPVIIRKALFGSHKLRTQASKRTIRVERIE